ncbi:hypothetical protein [Escherichia phage ZCEC12]|uniref:hypothetical protein n=1 Tax=Escherichia phage ZCEC10 TaxID=2894588 RepID=UPI00240D0B55|nr:hypothetical protein P9622_gp52 [Escherichia phage ZCEC10]UJQ87875.1 hypothetical protein [Escherichia phage ZCEC11]UJQ87965.1 hypothetical protein [Escherichia phage ZCEC12]UJQ88058.1 hypothetical protein [Escherichia phage ZCEC10]
MVKLDACDHCRQVELFTGYFIFAVHCVALIDAGRSPRLELFKCASHQCFFHVTEIFLRHADFRSVFAGEHDHRLDVLRYNPKIVGLHRLAERGHRIFCNANCAVIRINLTVKTYGQSFEAVELCCRCIDLNLVMHGHVRLAQQGGIRHQVHDIIFLVLTVLAHQLQAD